MLRAERLVRLAFRPGPAASTLDSARRVKSGVACRRQRAGSCLTGRREQSTNRTQIIMKILGHKTQKRRNVDDLRPKTSPTPSSWPTTSPSSSPAHHRRPRPTPCAGQLAQDALNWLKTNFYKTELELGHCLRLPQEGPCECDLYLTCAKFVTTPQYAPRLRERLCLERQLADDAEEHGWAREVERHRRTITRLQSLLKQLDEPLGNYE